MGAHELRFGTNTRIFRLNDYDFGEGVVPLVTYTTLPQFIYGVASTASTNFPACQLSALQFPESGSLCAGHLEGDAPIHLDLRHPRYTQFESVESAQCGGAAGRLVRLDFSRCQSAAERGNSDGALEESSMQRRSRFCSPERRSPGGFAPRRFCEAGSDYSAICCREALSIWSGANPPYSQTFQGGLLGTVGGTRRLRPECPNSAIDATTAANQHIQLGLRGRPDSRARPPSANPSKLPAAGGDHGRAGWKATCSLLHAVELCYGASDRQHTSTCGLNMSARAR